MKAFAHPAFVGTFGLARRDITPPAGIYSRNWGAALEICATSVHRPLMLDVLTFKDSSGEPPAAIITLDLGWWRSGEAERLLSQAVLDAGIESGRFIVTLSHTHSGPIFCPGESGKPGGEKIPSYLEYLCSCIREAIGEACAGGRTAILETTYGTGMLATNRDFLDPDSGKLLVGWNPGSDADNTILVGRITATDGSCMGTLVNYACHPTILAWQNQSISPDYVGALREKVELETGAPCLFLQGAAGELAPQRQYVGDPGIADRAGLSVAHSVLAALAAMLPPWQALKFSGSMASGAPLAIWETELREAVPDRLSISAICQELPVKPEFASGGNIAAAAPGPDFVIVERLERRRLIRESLNGLSSWKSVHNVWKLGDILLVAIANEAYSELQTALRSHVGDMPLFVATLSNGGLGYLAPRALYGTNAYAVWQSPFAEGCFEQTIDVLRSALTQLL